jgi:hypothetical protein
MIMLGGYLRLNYIQFSRVFTNEIQRLPKEDRLHLFLEENFNFIVDSSLRKEEVMRHYFTRMY